MEGQNAVEPQVTLEPTPQEPPPTTPAPLAVRLVRDQVDRWLAVAQFMTLIAVISYVLLTGWIAVVTKSATESGVRATKAQIAVTLVDELYSDPTVQEMLALIYEKKLEFKKENRLPVLTSADDSTKPNLEPKVALMLNKFQILGQLLKLGVLEKHDLIGLRYEIIEIGRNKAVREYFDFLNTDYVERSEIPHGHFENFKSLYLAFEYEKSHRKDFENYLYRYPPGTSPEDE